MSPSTRKELGITIKELSARIGTFSAARISNWEQCTRSPGPLEATLLAGQLNVSASYLLCLTDNPQGELSLSSKNTMRYISVLTMKEALHAKELMQANACLFAVLVEDNSMQPELNVGDLVIVDADRSPNPGDVCLLICLLKIKPYCASMVKLSLVYFSCWLAMSYGQR